MSVATITPTAPAEALHEEHPSASGPFEKYATASVLQSLEQFEISVNSTYQHIEKSDATRDTDDTSSGFIAEDNDEKPQSSSSESDIFPQSTSWGQVSIEGVLGEGGFSFIFKAKVESLGKRKNSMHVALKCLKAKAIKSEDDLRYNAMDLYTESCLLSKLRHPHIIGIHGCLDQSLSQAYQHSSEGGYFLLLDIMRTTLFDELNVWRDTALSFSRKTFPRNNSILAKGAIVDRIQSIIIPVVKAMQYLHSQGIVLRDLKPENIGFDEQGQVKLFDFGLARHISEVEPMDAAGSICYMAPEVMLEQGTYLQSDVYSFSIILWELCTLQIPLVDFEDMDEVKRKVAAGGWRPSTSSIPSKTLRNLVKSTWNRDPNSRPDFIEIERVLFKTCFKIDKDSKK